ncbi:MAG: hypothetical protein HDR02_02020 [Lachnospiraceae bacterium]|nr:hypothetical protein [Lachnospiraceae bacterium]
MNIGILIGIILVCLGAVTFWGMLFSDLKCFYNLPSTAIYFAIAAIICGFIVIICACAYKPYNPNAVNEQHQVKCQVCGRTFDNTSSDAKSIKWKNMCNQCYKNYNTAQDMIGN